MNSFDFIFLHPPRTFINPWSRLKGKALSFLKTQSLIPPSQYVLIPMGLFSLASSLIQEGYTAKIVNLALSQDIDPTFEVSRYLKSLEAKVFAIDMHWFTHTTSALKLAQLCKKHHPDSIVVLGGINATHFHQQIVNGYPDVDAVLLGEADLSVVQLAEAHLQHKSFSGVQGITYREGAKIRHVEQNPPPNLDVFEYTQLELLENYRKYLKTDITGHSNSISNIFWLGIARGCPYNCIYCSGGCEAYYHFSHREKPAFRTPQRVADDIARLCDYGVKGICFSHSPEIFGKKFWTELFEEIRKRSIDVSAYVDSYGLPSEEFVNGLYKTFSSLLIAMSPETASEDVRKTVGKDYSNSDFFRSIEKLREKDCIVHVHLAIGLPGETRESLTQYLKFIAKIFTLRALVLPPFPLTLDPSCLMALHSKRYGVKLLAKTLEDYMRISQSSKPKDWIGHETTTLTKDDTFTLLSKVSRYIANIYRGGLRRT